MLAAVVWWRQISPTAEAGPWRAVPMHPLGNDRWAAEVTLGPPGRVVFTIEAWPDLYRSWVSELERKVAVGRDVRSELLEGAALLRGCAARANAAHASHDAQLLDEAAGALEGPPMQAIDRATEVRVVEAATRYPDRAIGRRDPLERPVLVERERARSGAWYELFPRSAAHAERHGTFRDAAALLPEVERLGFDVVYFPPIHPIGRTARKGKNNAVRAEPDDVGSPWAIGAREGGHSAVHPELGTLEDFRHLVGRAAEHGLEVALDLAFQVSPDHPWVTEHPEWFQHRPDGTIKTAENPPKRYDDIVNFDFLGAGRSTLWPALRDVVLFWLERGVRIFRVDNPHTKPLPFWEWLLARGTRARSGRGVPLRGLHPAEADACTGEARVQPELHLLHLAEPQARAHRVLPGAAPARVGGCAPPEPMAQHPRHPARVPPARRSRGVPHPGRARRHARRLVRHLLGLRVLRRCGAAGRGVPRQREVPAGRLAGPPLRRHPGVDPPAQRDPPRRARTPAGRGAALPGVRRPPGPLLRQAHSRTGPARCWSR